MTAPPVNLQENNLWYSLLTILDVIFSSLVVCPCVVAYWRSVRGLMDVYLQTLPPLTSGLLSACIGLVGHVIFAMGQKLLEHNFHPKKHKILFYLTSRIYTACFAFTCVNVWRGIWSILDICFKKDLVSLVVTIAVSIVALISMKGIRNVTSPPFMIVNDDVKGYFEIMTMFKTTVSELYDYI